MSDESIAPTVTINVRLDITATPPVVLVDNGNGKNVFGEKGPAQYVSWQLTEPAGATFVPMPEAEPGFEWMKGQASRRSIFSPPDMIDPTRIDMTDTHRTSTSKGIWFYILRVRYGESTYETRLATNAVGLPREDGDPATSAEAYASAHAKVMVKDNPVIINR